MSKSNVLSKQKPLRSLTKEHERMVALMVHGLDAESPRLPDKAVGKPLSAMQVADELGLRRAHVHKLLEEPSFQQAIARATAARRSISAPQHIAKLQEIADAVPIEIKTSDIVKANLALLGEDAKGFSVNVQVNNQTNVANDFRAGYVLDLSARKPRHEPAMIEGKAE